MPLSEVTHQPLEIKMTILAILAIVALLITSRIAADTALFRVH